jgi:hypothetical protein
MGNTSRDLREKVVRALAKVGLVWAIAVLGALFMTMSAQAQDDDAYTLSSARADAQSTALSVGSPDAPRTAGLALALVVIGGGVFVLAVGASRGDRTAQPTDLDEPDPSVDLPLFLGVGLLT